MTAAPSGPSRIDLKPLVGPSGICLKMLTVTLTSTSSLQLAECKGEIMMIGCHTFYKLPLVTRFRHSYTGYVTGDWFVGWSLAGVSL